MSRSEGKERRGREGKEREEKRVSLQAAHLAGNGRDSKPLYMNTKAIESQDKKYSLTHKFHSQTGYKNNVRLSYTICIERTGLCPWKWQVGEPHTGTHTVIVVTC